MPISKLRGCTTRPQSKCTSFHPTDPSHSEWANRPCHPSFQPSLTRSLLQLENASATFQFVLSISGDDGGLRNSLRSLVCLAPRSSLQRAWVESSSPLLDVKAKACDGKQIPGGGFKGGSKKDVPAPKAHPPNAQFS